MSIFGKAMEDYIFNIETNLEPKAGRILISEPMLPDENFHRAVVYLCSHNKDGSLGFVFNQMIDKPIGHFIPELVDCSFPVYIGGPVGQQSLHIIHRKPLLLGGEAISEHLYLGAESEDLIEVIRTGEIELSDLKFFLGYSGWAPNQLDQEIAFNSWMVADCTENFFFQADSDNLWKKAIENLGDDYKGLLNLPSSPELN